MSDEPHNWLTLQKGPSLFGGTDHRFPHVASTLAELQTEMVLHQGRVTNLHCAFHTTMREWAEGRRTRADLDRERAAYRQAEADLDKVEGQVLALKQEQGNVN